MGRQTVPAHISRCTLLCLRRGAPPPRIKWLRRPEDIDGFARQQLQILSALWRLLARDGKLLYATCSVFARENQQVIDEFKQQHEDARSISLSVDNMKEGQLLPDEQRDGFYYALLHKSA